MQQDRLRIGYRNWEGAPAAVRKVSTGAAAGAAPPVHLPANQAIHALIVGGTGSASLACSADRSCDGNGCEAASGTAAGSATGHGRCPRRCPQLRVRRRCRQAVSAAPEQEPKARGVGSADWR